MKKNLLSCLLVLISCTLFAQGNSSDMYNLAQLGNGLKSKRISSADTTGGNGDCLKKIGAGQRRVLAKITGAGYINHIWMTSSFWKKGKNNIILRMYWDGNAFPSVEAPLGYFFGQGWEENYTYSSMPLSAAPKDGNALVSYFVMPYQKEAIIEIENDSDAEIESFYFYVDYVETEKKPANTGYFHSFFNMEVTPTDEKGENEWGVLDYDKGPTKLNKDASRNYFVAETKGKGQFVGINYYVNNPSPMWYGEGDDMIFIDDEKNVKLKGTGTEDYFNTSWCPQEIYNHPYFGYARVNKETGWLGFTHVYRFHITDPIYFDKYFKFTIEHGHSNCLTLQLASVAYYYVDKPTALPKPLPSKEVRTVKKFNYPKEILKWRNEWRKSQGNKPDLWGDETK